MPLQISAVAGVSGPPGAVEHTAVPLLPHTTLPEPQAPAAWQSAPSGKVPSRRPSSVWPSQLSSRPLHTSGAALLSGPPGSLEHIGLPPVPHMTLPMPHSPVPRHGEPTARPPRENPSSVRPSQLSSKPLQISAWTPGLEPPGLLEHSAPWLPHSTTPGPQAPVPSQGWPIS